LYAELSALTLAGGENGLLASVRVAIQMSLPQTGRARRSEKDDEAVCAEHCRAFVGRRIVELRGRDGGAEGVSGGGAVKKIATGARLLAEPNLDAVAHEGLEDIARR